MTSIIAYGTVVRAPQVIGLPLPGEERSVGFSVVVEEDFCDQGGDGRKRGLYRVVLGETQASHALAHLKIGSSVLIRGELFAPYAPFGDPAWNHRLLFGEELIVLPGELPTGRAYAITSDEKQAPIAVSA
jgi:hypothetical protein